MATEPVGQALLTCDAVARDPNGKITLYGIFDRIWAGHFPAVHPMLSIYWKCEIPGPGRVGVRLLKPDGTSLLELEPVESGREPAHSMQGTYTVSPVEFPVDGEYTLVLLYKDREVMKGALHVQKRATK
jgi:hypothetical protein